MSPNKLNLAIQQYATLWDEGSKKEEEKSLPSVENSTP